MGFPAPDEIKHNREGREGVGEGVSGPDTERWGLGRGCGGQGKEGFGWVVRRAKR